MKKEIKHIVGYCRLCNEKIFSNEKYQVTMDRGIYHQKCFDGLPK